MIPFNGCFNEIAGVTWWEYWEQVVLKVICNVEIWLSFDANSFIIWLLQVRSRYWMILIMNILYFHDYTVNIISQENKALGASNDSAEPTAKDISSAYLSIAELYMTDLWYVTGITLHDITANVNYSPPPQYEHPGVHFLPGVKVSCSI